MRNIIKRIIKEVSEEKPKSNLNRLLDKIKMKFPEQYRDKVDVIEKFVVDYITDHNFNVKFLKWRNWFVEVLILKSFHLNTPHELFRNSRSYVFRFNERILRGSMVPIIQRKTRGMNSGFVMDSINERELF